MFGSLFFTSNFSIIDLRTTSTLPRNGERKFFPACLLLLASTQHPQHSLRPRPPGSAGLVPRFCMTPPAPAVFLAWLSIHPSVSPGEFLQSAPRPPAEGWEARHLHSTSQGCSDCTCNSSDKSLSAMPMAKSVVTLFILISSAQISSSQRLAGSYRFLINVLTDFPDLGRKGWGLGWGGGGGL